MDNTKKIQLNDRQIHEIKAFAADAFRKERSFARFDAKEMQIYLILRGLEAVLLKNGINPGFEIAYAKVEDSDPVDDSGLGDFVDMGERKS